VKRADSYVRLASDRVREIEQTGHEAAEKLSTRQPEVLTHTIDYIADRVGGVADYFENRDVRDILDDTRRLVRDHPVPMIGDFALLGIAAGRFLLADSDGGIVVAAMAERLAPLTAAHLTAVLDSGALRSERDGIALDAPARIAIVALDEGIAEDERPPAPLLDRLAFHLDLAAASDVHGFPCIQAFAIKQNPLFGGFCFLSRFGGVLSRQDGQTQKQGQGEKLFHNNRARWQVRVECNDWST
jgi:hypothetical protein